ncbi:hypothetical protein ACQ4PT_036090 [Festuca glaucescens]
MSSAVATPASFLALASASPGRRRRARVSAPPPLHANRWLALHWPPSTRDGPVAARAEAGKKGARGDDAASAGKVAKRRDPAVLTVDRYGAGDAAKGGGDSPPAPGPLDAPRPPTTQNAVLANGETVPVRGLSPPAPRQDAVSVNGQNKSTVAAPLPSTAKVVLPGSVPILPARTKAPILPAEKTRPPVSRPNLVSAPPRPSTVGDVASAEKMIADIVEKASKPKTLSPPATTPAVQELWDFKKYIGFEEPVEEKDDGRAAADAAGSFENHQNHDSGPLAGENVMNVILVSAECGLGDVAGALPKALARRGHRVMVVVPRYGDYEEAYDLGIRKYYKAAGQDLEVNYFHAYIDGVDFVFIDAPLFRHRQHDIYGGSRQEIMKRMILFCKVAVEGRGPVAEFPYTDLPEHYLEHFKLYDPIGGEHANYFAAGVKMADQVVAVSRGYLWELKTVEGGWGLHDIIRQNDSKIHGIVNGIDNEEWNPEVDVHLHSDGYTNYTLRTLDASKRQCKEALQRELGLEVRGDVPLIGFIGRLDGQKGVEIIADAMPWIVSQDVQLVMLGTGRDDLERMLRHFECQHNDKVRGWVGFSVPLAHRITAGADVLVMPSRFEPCGLNQLYAMAYGTIPVVHAVGGLRDTVSPFDPFGDSGLGWTFDRAEAQKLIEALGHCLNTYRNYRESWRGIQERGMSQNFSWEHAAKLYEDVLVKAKYQW